MFATKQQPTGDESQSTLEQRMLVGVGVGVGVDVGVDVGAFTPRCFSSPPLSLEQCSSFIERGAQLFLDLFFHLFINTFSPLWVQRQKFPF